MALLTAHLLADLLALVLLLTVCFALYIRHHFSYWWRHRIPEIPATFPFGNFLATFAGRQSFGDRTTELYRHHPTAPFLGIWMGLQPTLLLRDPRIIRHVLIRDFAQFPERGIYSDERSDPLSANLFSLPAAKWHALRHKLSPTFSSGRLRAMFATIRECGEPLQRHMVARMAATSSGAEVFEMRELLAQFTTNVIASVAFGVQIDCIAEPDNAFRRFANKVFEPSVWKGLRGALVFFFPRLLQLLRLRAVDRDVEEFFVQLVRANLELREAPDAVTRKDFFQLLVQLRNGGLSGEGEWGMKKEAGEEGQVGESKSLSIEQCAAQSFVFYLAGFETSSTTTSFALYELAANPDCQRRVQAEIDEVLAEAGGEITYEAVAQMKYLEWCIDETLRKYPPVPLLNRVCVKAWTIPDSGGQTIEPGTPIIIPIHALHWDPAYFEQPHRFDPERFSPRRMAGQESDHIQQAYLPFGDGPRNCIGMRLGKIQTKIGLIVMLRKFSFELAGNTCEPLVMNPSRFMLEPIGGVHLRVTARVGKL